MGSEMCIRDRSEDNGKGGSAEKAQQANEKSTSGRAANDEPNGKKSSAKSGADEDSGSKRTGREGSGTTDKSAQTKDGSSSDKTDRSATDTNKGATTDRSAESKPSADKAKHVDLSGDKRTKVQTAFRDTGSNVKHHTDVNITISVGRRLRRDWGFVRVVPGAPPPAVEARLCGLPAARGRGQRGRAAPLAGISTVVA